MFEKGYCAISGFSFLCCFFSSQKIKSTEANNEIILELFNRFWEFTLCKAVQPLQGMELKKE